MTWSGPTGNWSISRGQGTASEVISDVVAAAPGAEHESTLSEMLSGGTGGFNPLERTGDIVQFYLETLAPTLS